MAAAIPLEEYLAKGAVVSATQLLTRVAISYFFKNPPEGSKMSPVFSMEDERIGRVLHCFREVLVQKLGEDKARDLLPSTLIDERLPEERSTLLNPVYFRIMDLRPEHIPFTGAVRDIIEHIHAKLRAYYASYGDGWIFDSPHWGTKKPIDDPILLILLLINRVLIAVGSYRKRINPDDAIALINVIFAFKTRLEGEELSNDGRSGDDISMATLFFDTKEEGLIKPLKDLQFVFNQEKERRLFVSTIQGMEQNVFQLSRGFQSYALEWLQGNDELTARTASELIVPAGAVVIPNHGYPDLSTDTREGSLKHMVKKFCEKRCGEEMYRILQLLAQPIELSPPTASSSPEQRILMALHQKLSHIYGEGGLPLETFKSECQRQIASVLKEIKFTELPALDLLNMLLWSRYFMIVKDILNEVAILGDLVGCMAGALLPNVIKCVQRLLVDVSGAVQEFEGVIAEHQSLRAYQDTKRAGHLRAILSTVVESMRTHNIELEHLKSDLIVATSDLRLRENEAQIYASLASLRRSLLIIYPNEKSVLQEEMAQFSREIHRLLGHRPAAFAEETKRASYTAAALDTLLKNKLSAVLFTEGHLKIINEAYLPTSSGRWKTEAAIDAKNNLHKFLEAHCLKGPDAKRPLTAVSFASFNLQDLNDLKTLLLGIYQVSRQKKKRILLAQLNKGLSEYTDFVIERHKESEAKLHAAALVRTGTGSTVVSASGIEGVEEEEKKGVAKMVEILEQMPACPPPPREKKKMGVAGMVEVLSEMPKCPAETTPQKKKATQGQASTPKKPVAAVPASAPAPNPTPVSAPQERKPTGPQVAATPEAQSAPSATVFLAAKQTEAVPTQSAPLLEATRAAGKQEKKRAPSLAELVATPWPSPVRSPT